MTPLIALLVLSQAQTPEPLYRFVAYGDTRGRSAKDYDMTVQSDIIAGAVAAKPALILQTGDLVFDSSIPELWPPFEKAMKPVWDAKIPYYPARGNHDAIGKSLYLPFLKKRIVRNWHVRRGGDLLHYSVDKGPLRFVAIDTEVPTAPGSRQYRWIESELADAKAHGMYSVPFFHRALHTIGAHGPDLKRQAELQPLFERYRVPIAFQGHDHDYYRTYRKGTFYVVTGGGGAPLYELSPEKDPRLNITDPLPDPTYADVAAKAFHYCVCDVYPDRIDITVVPVRYAKGSDAIDHFSVALSPAAPRSKEG